MSSERLPLVSIAIPLYRSRRFVDLIVRNVETIDYPNVEIIVSDRHGADDAFDLLYERFEDDARLRFVREVDGAGWVAHYNYLLQAASGTYFCWMPHDDSYPPDYVTQLVAALEEDPDAVLAFGRMEAIDLAGAPAPRFPFAAPPASALSQPAGSLPAALTLLTDWNLGIAFRGLFRRERLLAAGLLLRDTRGSVGADVFWMFGVCLLGRLRFVPSCSCLKRYYPESTHARWRYGVRQRLEAFFVLRGYLADHAAGRREVAAGTWRLLGWTKGRVVSVARQRLLRRARQWIPPRLRRRMVRILRRG